MTHLDLFSGIGGFALAARWAGIKTVQFVELDPFCQKVLNKNFPGVPIWDDIKTYHYGDVSCQESVQTAKSVKSQEKESPTVNRAIQSVLPFGEKTISKEEGNQTGSGANVKNEKSLTTTGESVCVVGKQQESSSPLIINTTTETPSEESTNPKHGNSPLKGDCQTTIKSSATTAITPKQTMEYAHTREDQICQKVLKKNFQGVPIHDDIKTFTYATIENDGRYSRGTQGRQESESGSGAEPGAIRETTASPFLLTAGTPCQPASCAGKRRGTSDDRWLWGETFRVIAEVKPKWCILENVRGLLSLEGGVVFEDLLLELEAIGYETRTFIIPACAKNAPHRRDRVWIVGRSIDTDTIEPGAGNNGGQASDKGRGTGEDRRESIRQTNREACTGWADATDCHAPDTEKPGLEGRNATGTGLTGGWDTEHAIGGIGTDQAGPWQEPWIEAATRLCTVDDGLPGGLVRPRGWRVNALKAAGNAIVPQVAYQIIRAILTAEEA